MINILFVCMGNICRSPSAEGFFVTALQTSKYREQISTDSAGTHGYHVGHAPDPRAVATALDFGVDISQLCARKVSVSDFDNFDLIIAMDSSNFSDLQSIQPAGFQSEFENDDAIPSRSSSRRCSRSVLWWTGWFYLYVQIAGFSDTWFAERCRGALGSVVEDVELKQSKADFDGKKFTRRLSAGPGVYLMRDADGIALYVGKAANLRKRVSSYFDARPKIERIMRMVARIQSIEVSLTRTEAEALLLENEWIKSLKPRYNVLLRDDKSYPWVMLGTDHEFPRIAFHRGGKDKDRQYLGPYPSASSVRESINLIQKLFLLRNCEDSYFSHRTRPCLQYQIKRCTAPCVGMVSPSEYAGQIDDALLFLRGHSQKVITRLIGRMEHAAGLQQYEQAAQYRDQINHLKQMQARQFVSAGNGDLDIIALARLGNSVAIEVISVRGGRSLGQRDYFPTQSEGHSDGEILHAFLGQYFSERQAPPELIISHPLDQQKLFEAVFSERSGRRVHIQSHPRSHRRKWLELAGRNALNALHMRNTESSRISWAICRTG